MSLFLNLNHLVSRNQTSNLPMIPRHSLVNDGHLLDTQVTATVDLYSEAAEDLAVYTAEADIVVFFGATNRLLVSGLVGVELDQRLNGPSLIGGQLVLDVRLDRVLHCENSIPHPGQSTSTFFNFFFVTVKVLGYPLVPYPGFVSRSDTYSNRFLQTVNNFLRVLTDHPQPIVVQSARVLNACL